MPEKSTVAVLGTRPQTCLSDFHRLMNLAGYRQALDPSAPTILKINISWQQFFPACSSNPWQIEGVIRALLKDRFSKDRLQACHNRTVVVSAKTGEARNKHRFVVVDRFGLPNIHLYEDEGWIHIRQAVGDLADHFLVLNKVYPDGFRIPRRFLDSNIIHLPTVKTHIFTTMTGAMKNAFGGLLNEKRHWTHPVIHETLVDLLRIQKKIHKGVFAVMDGTFAGDGPGPRCMVPYVKNVLLASADQVAIDAVAARMMGFDPMEIRFIRLAVEQGLGNGEMKSIEIVGDPGLAAENWHFTGPFRDMTFAGRMQHKIYWGPLKPVLEWSLKTWLAPWSYLASIAYHDWYWYPFVGKERVDACLNSDWGRLFKNYERLQPDESGWDRLEP
jgi:uncharacterized protein (DUF362 family)